MKKSLLLCSACFTLAIASAQSKEITTFESQVTAAKPPSPPAPPAAPMPHGEINSIAEPPAPPPPPPLPPIVSETPIPPVPPVPAIESGEITINSTGYDISIRKIKGEDVVVVKQGKTKKFIKMKTWLADRKYYESKYGHLPPPPPPIQR